MKGIPATTLVALLFFGCARGVDPLVIAAHDGDLEKLTDLLDEGADPEVIQGRNGWTPLHIAASAGHAHIVAALLDAGANVNGLSSVNGMDGATPLIFAASFGHTNVISLLAERGCDLHVRYRKKSAVEFAEMKGHSNAVALLRSISLE